MPVILYGVSGGYLFALAEVVDVIVFSIFFCGMYVVGYSDKNFIKIFWYFQY